MTPFSKNQVTAIFERNRSLEDKESTLWRIDSKGKTIHRAAYGDRNSQYGWDVHHVNKDGEDNASRNLEALHHETHKKIHR